jgi:hypothetical protein
MFRPEVFPTIEGEDVNDHEYETYPPLRIPAGYEPGSAVYRARACGADGDGQC